MASSPRRISVRVAPGNQAMVGSGLQQEELEAEEFDALLHPNVLDTLADFDFSYANLGGGGGLDAAQKQLHQQLLTSPKPPTGRKRSFTQACTWDNLGPKALSEISASLLAGGGWEGMQAPPAAGAVGVDAPGPSCSSVPLPTMVDSALAAAAAAARKQEVGRLGGHNREAPTGGCTKGRRGSGAGTGAGGGEGGGKWPLNPERMERKASREKRRREEVNEKFEQLIKVLADAQVTSGLEPPATKEGGKAAHACINGRRVEVLSRTINILKKLLQARRGSPAAAAAAGGSVGAAGEEEKPVSPGLESAAVGLERPSDAPAGSPPPEGDSASAPLTADTATAAAAAGEAIDAAALETRVAVEAAAANNPQAVVHHMAMPMSGHHASLMMPPGFAGMQAPHGMPPGQHGMPGHQGQPIFIAVPMYMPHGQGVPPSSSSSATEGPSAQAQAPAAASIAPSTPAAPAGVLSAAAAAHPAPTVVAATKEALGMNPPSKAYAMPAGMGFQQMTLQMPQFVAQALSADEGDENPTHAVCA